MLDFDLIGKSPVVDESTLADEKVISGDPADDVVGLLPGEKGKRCIGSHRSPFEFELS